MVSCVLAESVEDYSRGHNIMKLSKILVQVRFATSKAVLDVY